MGTQVRFAGMMEYDGELHIPKHFLVSPPNITKTSGEYLVHNGIATFACSESQKIGHVTFFWNGNRGEHSLCCQLALPLKPDSCKHELNCSSHWLLTKHGHNVRNDVTTFAVITWCAAVSRP